MRALSLLLLTGLMTGACVSTGRDGTTLPGASDKQSPQTATAHAAAAPEAGESARGPGALRIVARELALADATADAAAAPAEPRAFDPGEVHNRSGRRGTSIIEYFHGESAMASLHADHSVQFDPDWMVAHFVDVGQGDAILLEFECGAALIDTGGEETGEVNGAERLGEYLDTFFARRSDLSRTLDLVALSHPHKDHTLGVLALTGNPDPITIRNVIDNSETEEGSGIDGQKKLQSHAAASGIGYQAIRNQDIEYLDGLTSGVIDPIRCPGVDPVFRAAWGRDSDAWNSNGNNHSLVLRLDFGQSSFLFMGDSQLEALSAMLDSYAEDLSILDVDVLKVGHHGSHNATSIKFLRAATPEIAVIQAGDSNLSQERHSAYSYGHPNQKAIDLLVHQTDGVSGKRAPIVVDVGVKGLNPKTGAPPVFTTMTIDRAVYAVSWDGTIIVEAKKDGTLRVLTSK